MSIPALVSAEVDLRDFAYMPLDVVRLRDSDLSGCASAEEFRCAVLLWCAAWHQKPAASLPDIDSVLAILAGLGRDVATWETLKDGAMRGWIKCDDGRWYHPVVAEKAREAWEQKLARKARTDAARRAKLLQAAGSSPPPDVAISVTGSVTESVTASVTESVTGSKGTERNGTEYKEDTPSLRSGVQGDADPCETLPRTPSQKPKATRLPIGWNPDSAGIAFATETIGAPAAEIELAKFRDYWAARAGAGGSKLDWPATWRNWVRTAAERLPPARASPSGFNGASRSNPEKSVHAAINRLSDRVAQGEILDFGELPTPYALQLRTGDAASPAAAGLLPKGRR
jgi:hypothetical protein